MVKLLQFTLRDFGPIYTPPQNVCREWVVVVMCRNWGIIRARDIAIRHLHKYPTFRMLHSLGGPLFYIYTLTVDGRMTDATGTNLCGSGSGRRIPVPGQPSGRRQPSYKCITDRACVSLGYFPGRRTGGPFLRLRPSVHLAQALSNRLGTRKGRKKHLLDLAMT